MKRIKLTQGKFALVDDEDYDYLSKFKWYAYCSRGIFYAGRTEYINGKGHILQMHVTLLGRKMGAEIDHKNRNGLDNRKENLRFSTHSENCRNRSKLKGKSSMYVGVSWDKKIGLWRSYIKIKGKLIHLGLFSSEIEASAEHNKAEKNLIK